MLYRKYSNYVIIKPIPNGEKLCPKQTQQNTHPAKEIWKTLKEISKSQKENEQWIQETKQIVQETDRIVQETALQMKETDRRLKKAEGLFTTQWGKLMETLVEGDLLKLLKQQGITVKDTTMNMKSRYNKEEDWEIDILASNGEEIVIVEVKTTLKVQDVKELIYKLKKFTTWKPIYKKKKIYGAVAYLKEDHNSTKYAEKQGLFVIRATGSSASIINKQNFKPKIFS